MNVDTNYRRAGIAYEMMKVGVECYGDDFSKPNFNSCGGKHANAEDYYTQEGSAFIWHCVSTGLLKDTEYDESHYEDEY
jgi:hypothetical protein